jgi:hypothetical protein
MLEEGNTGVPSRQQQQELDTKALNSRVVQA